jgi:microcystin-dependent protein
MDIGSVKMRGGGVTHSVGAQTWMLCNGQALVQAAYPQLFALLGVTYGFPGPGLFNLPNYALDPVLLYAGRLPVGQSALGFPMGTQVGVQLHQHTLMGWGVLGHGALGLTGGPSGTVKVDGTGGAVSNSTVLHNHGMPTLDPHPAPGFGPSTDPQETRPPFLAVGIFMRVL